MMDTGSQGCGPQQNPSENSVGRIGPMCQDVATGDTTTDLTPTPSRRPFPRAGLATGAASRPGGPACRHLGGGVRV